MCPGLFPLIVIQIIWIFYILFKIKTALYKDDEFTEKVQTPIWFYLLGLLISIIPALGLVGILIIHIVFFVDVDAFPEPTKYSWSSTPTYYYKPGWFLKLLNKFWEIIKKPL